MTTEVEASADAPVAEAVSAVPGDAPAEAPAAKDAKTRAPRAPRERPADPPPGTILEKPKVERRPKPDREQLEGTILLLQEAADVNQAGSFGMHYSLFAAQNSAQLFSSEENKYSHTNKYRITFAWLKVELTKRRIVHR
jgi:hypothetical protein